MSLIHGEQINLKTPENTNCIAAQNCRIKRFVSLQHHS